MESKNFVVTCRKCKGSSRLAILDGKTVMYKDHLPIISARLRPDLKWGFECMCGNDSRIAPQEKDDVPMLVQGSEENVVKSILKGLKANNHTRFVMESA